MEPEESSIRTLPAPRTSKEPDESSISTSMPRYQDRQVNLGSVLAPRVVAVGVMCGEDDVGTDRLD